MQWYNNDTHEIGVYEPNYSPEQNPGRGKLIEWNAGQISSPYNYICTSWLDSILIFRHGQAILVLG